MDKGKDEKVITKSTLTGRDEFMENKRKRWNINIHFK